jgi:hypothetical protein
MNNCWGKYFLGFNPLWEQFFHRFFFAPIKFPIIIQNKIISRLCHLQLHLFINLTFIFLSFSLSLFLSFTLSLFLSFSLSLFLSFSLSLCLSFSLSLFLIYYLLLVYTDIGKWLLHILPGIFATGFLLSCRTSN